MTFDLFTPAMVSGELEPGAAASPMTLHVYQSECVAAIEAELAKPIEEVRGTLAVMATGTGKTVVFVKVMAQRKGRCLILAHRDELIQQAARKVESIAGVFPDIEKAAMRANHFGTRPVIASVQTLSQPGRLHRFDPGEFELIILDEAHHSTAPSWKKVTDYFASARLLGVTATSDRADGEALGQLFSSVAYEYDLHRAIREGYLSPIVMQRVIVAGLDWSKVRTTAGDLNQKDVEAIVAEEEILHGFAKPTIELAGTRKTIVFAPGVKSAHRLAEIIGRYTGDEHRACVVDGMTETDTRRAILKAFSEGKHQFLVNVGIATEGYDEPAVACIAMARPTKSRSLYAQMAGRGTRISPGKDNCLLIDFAGNAGRHDLVSAADILGGKISDRELAQAKKVIAKAKQPISMEQAIAEAKRVEAEQRRAMEEAMRRRRAGVKADVKYHTEGGDPYARRTAAPSTGPRGELATDKQRKYLRYLLGGFDPDPNLSKKAAGRLIGEHQTRKAHGLSSYAQMREGKALGVDVSKMTAAEAWRAIGSAKATRSA